MFAVVLNGFKCKSNKVCAGFRGVQAAPRKIRTVSIFFIQAASICTEQIESGRKSDMETKQPVETTDCVLLLETDQKKKKKEENAFNFIAMVEP